MATETTPRVQTKVLNSSDPSLPPLVLQITQMVDTYMLWIGAADGNTNVGNGENAVLNGNLCKDWACAMPPRFVGFRVSYRVDRNRRTEVFITVVPSAWGAFRSDISVSISKLGHCAPYGTAFR